MANSNQRVGSNSNTEHGVTRREFIKYSAGTVAYISLSSLTYGCAYNSKTQATSYQIAENVATTLQKTVKLSRNFSGTIAAKDLHNLEDYDKYGYGKWSDGGPLAAVRRKDIMAADYTFPEANKPLNFTRFFSISDIHITDKESPSQLIYMQPANIFGNILGKNLEASCTSAYSPTMLYTPHVLDAAVQTVNALHKMSPIDFGISLGDTCNSTQYNETRWYIDVLDGKVITPSSGANVGADTIEYQKPFKAAGLDPSIPWYQTTGNHDHFWLGSIPPDAGDLRKTHVSDEVLAMSDALVNASNIYNTNPVRDLYYMGVIDGSTPTGKIIKAGKVGAPGFTTPPKVVPDKNRRSLTKTEWKQEFFTTSTQPTGHGFNLVPPGHEDGFTCYSFVPKSNIPIKVIVLDNTQREDDGAVSIHGRGFLDQARWAWLKNELAAGDAVGQLMIIATHVPIGVCPHANPHANPPVSDTYMDWYDNSANPSGMQNAVDLPGLLAELRNHPNLLMWMAGHRHVNTVKAFKTDDATRPERGFWHVETSSLHDFPQQFRMFEINLNSDYTISIITTNVDPAVQEGTPAWTARKYAVATQQIVENTLNPNFVNADPDYPVVLDPTITKTNSEIDPDVLSYNAELFKQLSPDMKAKVQALFPVL